MENDWYMGGVHNHDLSAEVYDLITGRKAELTEVLDLGRDEIAVLLRRIVVEYIAETPLGWYAEPGTTEILAHYDYGDFNTRWFLRGDGEIVLAFAEYELTCGAQSNCC